MHALIDAHFLTQGQCPEADVAVLSGNKRVTAMLMMKADKRFPMTIGGVDCRLINYKVRHKMRLTLLPATSAVLTKSIAGFLLCQL